jgi:hypothetical protein
MRTHRTGRYGTVKHRAIHLMAYRPRFGNRYDDAIAGVASAARGG